STLVSALVDLNPPAGGLDNVSDADGVPLTGIALTAADTQNGTWFYSRDGGSTWVDVDQGGAVSQTNALLLAADANTRLFFRPTADFTGTASLAFQAWDQSNGGALAGSKVDVSNSGATTPYSTASEVASITVNPVPDITPDAFVTNEDTAISANLITGTNG